MCVDMGGGGSHLREREGGSQGVREKGGSRGVHKKGVHVNPMNPWLRTCECLFI